MSHLSEGGFWAAAGNPASSSPKALKAIAGFIFIGWHYCKSPVERKKKMKPTHSL
jgi:hypothetical protein